MKKILISFCILMSCLTGYATDTQVGADVLTDQQKEEGYVYQCGSLKEVVTLAKAANAVLTDADIKDLIKSRKSTLDVIRRGKAAIEQLLDQGDKDDIGGLGVLLVCGFIDQAADKIQARGCVDLETNEVVKAGVGIKVCQDTMANINKK